MNCIVRCDSISRIWICFCLKKSLKQLLAEIFWTPSPLFENGPYWRKRRYFVPNSNYKVRFFWIFKPPPYFIRKPNLTDFINWGGPLTNLFWLLYQNLTNLKIGFCRYWFKYYYIDLLRRIQWETLNSWFSVFIVD